MHELSAVRIADKLVEPLPGHGADLRAWRANREQAHVSSRLIPGETHEQPPRFGAEEVLAAADDPLTVNRYREDVEAPRLNQPRLVPPKQEG
ncbi:MAG: hypothetical protein OXI50_09805 [Gammaproteobacteria bacterium]|nr:hypothetical protein [Gammaproteobacteria bacterium]